MAPGPPTSSATQSRSQRVSVQHTLERVRNNQRQHRARRRAYIETLETRLAQAEQTVLRLTNELRDLRTAHSQRRDLRRTDAVAVHRHETSLTPVPESGGSTSQSTGLDLESTGNAHWRLLRAEPISFPRTASLFIGEELMEYCVPAVPGLLNDAEHYPLPGDLSWSHGSMTYARSAAEPEPEPDGDRHTAPGPDTQILCPQTALVAACDALHRAAYSETRESCSSLPNCLFRPAVEMYYKVSTDDEPTLLCSEASILIAAQNRMDVSQEVMAMWLWNGFRKAWQPGGGCRVHRDILSSLLAFINSGS